MGPAVGDAVDRLGGPYEWRYVAGGIVVHALRRAGDAGAMCGVTRLPASSWRGTGSQAEYETAAALPVCEKCAAMVAGGRFSGRQVGGPRRRATG